MFGVAIASFLLLLVVAYLIARPLLAPEPAVEEAEGSKLLADKERQLADIRELDMDYATGKLTEEDYRNLRAHSLAETAATMQALDEAEALQAPEVPTDEQPDLAITAGNGHALVEEDDLERAIAARKRSIEERVR